MMNKIYTNNAPEAIGPYSQAVECGGLIYTSGQIAINPESGQIESNDIKGQTTNSGVIRFISQYSLSSRICCSSVSDVTAIRIFCITIESTAVSLL